jgi:uncharacterized membrane protein YfcA
MFDFITVAVIVGTFILAGGVKGLIGFGLPTVSLALLTVALDLTTAMALLLVPSLVTNLWQAMTGGNGRELLLRIWPFLLMATATVWLGAAALTRMDLSLLSALLGGLLVFYSALNLADFHLTITVQRETWAGPIFGIANGILTGMTGSFIVPGIMFLQGIGLSRHMLVQAMGMLFTASTLALGIALQSNSLLTTQLSLVSVAAVIPTAIGMVVGQRIRSRLSEARFQQIFFFATLVLGLCIIAKSALTFL